jgi:acyl-CoA synthetase (AMP-forming)/AMP-acid ligase II
MILDLLENGDPSHPAVIVAGNGLAVSYSQLQQQVDLLVKDLRRLGLGKGDRIAMALPNGLEVIASFLAASTVGTAAPLNPAYTRDEFKY